MNPRLLTIGIMPRHQFQQYTIAIAKGKCKPPPNAPKIWFESLKSLSQVLNDDTQKLLEMIEKNQPHSLQELAELTGKSHRQVSRRLNRMAHHGIVELVKTRNHVRPVVKATDFRVEFGLHSGVD